MSSTDVVSQRAEPGRLSAVLRLLPTGRTLSDSAWWPRQRAMQWVLWAHLPFLTAVAASRGDTAHLLLELAPIAILTAAASSQRLSRTWRMALATTALVSCSSLLVHLTDGIIESHFHFFAVVAFVMLYESWMPFVLCLGWVVFHHVVVGVLAPQAIYNHPAAVDNPALWAVVHGAYIVVASAASVVSWRFSETERRRAELLMLASADPTYGVDLKGRIRLANRALAQLLDTTPDALMEQRAHELLHGWTLDGCPLCPLLARPEAATLSQITLTTPDGTSFPADIDNRPVIDRGAHIGWVITFRDVSERIAHERMLKQLALTDQLTDLATRTLAVDHLLRALGHLARAGQHVGVLFCDLDRFKSVNDSLGHAAGDDLLVEVAARLRQVVRSSDTVARVGGDEFVIICPVLESPQEAVRLAQRVCDALAEPVRVCDVDVHVGVSIGIRTTADPAVDPERLLADADAAMYQAKACGSDVVVYTDQMRVDAVDRVTMETELRRAIEQGQLVLHYQPTVSLTAGEVNGVEALVRWNHPTRGQVPPGEFIPMAEETGLITSLGAWVIKAAAAQLDAWHTAAPDRLLSMSVNLSGRQLRDSSVVELTAELLERYDFEPAQWVFEITETVLMREGDAALDMLAALHDLGVRLAIDDFGTGYSSLSSLRRFPIDILKIDRAFVSGINGDHANRQLVAAIVGMAGALGMATTAEGIEGALELDVLRQLGCDVGQGYLLGRPSLPMASIEALLNVSSQPDLAV